MTPIHMMQTHAFPEVKDVSDIAKERCDLAKALIRASAKAAKPPVKRPSDKSDKADTAAKGAS